MTLKELWEEYKEFANVEIRVGTYPEPTESVKADEAYLVSEMKTGEIYIAIVG